MRPSHHSTNLAYDLTIHDVYQSRDLNCLRKFLSSIENNHHHHLKPNSHSHHHHPRQHPVKKSSSPINRLDAFGRTLIHKLAASSLESQSIEWLRELIIHHDKHHLHTIQINITDLESGWTPLHRALYHGNLTFAKILIERLGCELHLRDHEGLTPFDLYNLTINDDPTLPIPSSKSSSTQLTYHTDLFTWGSNRNFVLGIHDDGDRHHPERIHLQTPNHSSLDRVRLNPFISNSVNLVTIGRLHTALITSDGQLRVCGFGSGGRLGLTTNNQTINHHDRPNPPPISTEAQFTFAPVKAGGLANQRVKSVALGQDHTVVITQLGQVYTFGMNRFGQLGYGPENNGASIENMIQVEPKRVLGFLKKVNILGAAASRWHTAVFNSDSLYTWGANRGQLGYHNPHPHNSSSAIQITPRRVPIAHSSIIQVTCTNFETAYLCQNSHEVYLLKSDTTIRVVFGFDRFPSDIHVSGMAFPQQGQSIKSTRILQIDCSDQTLGALSSMGDVYLLDLENPNPLDYPISHVAMSSSPHRPHTALMPSGGPAFKPRRIWTSTRWTTAAKHIAVGVDGDVMIATLPGHVYMGSRRSGGGGGSLKSLDARSTEQLTTTGTSSSTRKNYKFQRVPYLQRVSQVAINPTGSYAAIRRDVQIHEIHRTLPEERSTLPSMLSSMLLHLKNHVSYLPELHMIPSPQSIFTEALHPLDHSPQLGHAHSDSQVYSDTEDENIIEAYKESEDLSWDVRVGSALLNLSLNWVEHHSGYSLDDGDIFLVAKTGERVLVHQFILCSRSLILNQIINNNKVFSGISYQPNDLRSNGDAHDANDPSRLPKLHFDDHLLLTLLLLVHYLYTDNYPSLWDNRVWPQIEKAHQQFLLQTDPDSNKSHNPSIVILANEVKAGLKNLAISLGCPALEQSLDRFGKSIPKPTLSEDLYNILSSLGFKDDLMPATLDVDERRNLNPLSSQAVVLSNHPSHPSTTLSPDIELELKGGENLRCHSILMRAQCPFFRLMYDQGAWTTGRRLMETGSKNLMIKIDMRHLTKKVMQVVLRHVYTDDEDHLFLEKDFHSLNEYLDFVFEVMAVANELMMDKLKFICSVILRRYINLSNVTAIAAEADFYRADSLKETCMNYMIHNVESIFQDQGLIKIPDDLLLAISNYLKSFQAEKFPLSRSTDPIDQLMKLHSQFLSDLDLPQPKLTLTSRHWKSLNKPLTSVVSAPSNPQSFLPEIDGLKRSPDKRTLTTKGFAGMDPEQSANINPSSPTHPSFLHSSGSAPRTYTTRYDHHPLNASPEADTTSTPLSGHGDEILDNLVPFVMDDVDGAVGTPTKVPGKSKSNGSPLNDTSPWATPVQKVTPVDLRTILSTDYRRASSNLNSDGPGLGTIRSSADCMIPSQKLSQREKRRQLTEAFKPKSELTLTNQNHQPKSFAWRSVSGGHTDRNGLACTPPTALSSLKSSSPSCSPTSLSIGGLQQPAKPPRPEAQTLLGQPKVSSPAPTSYNGARRPIQKDNVMPNDPASAIGASVITPVRAVGGISSSSSHSARRVLGGQDTPWTNYASSSAAGAKLVDLNNISPSQQDYFKLVTGPREEAANRNIVEAISGGKNAEQEESSSKNNNFLLIQETQAKERLGLNLFRSGKLIPNLMEIQEEENRKMIERKQEQEFLKWFEEESKRLQQSQAQSKQSSHNRSRKASRHKNSNHCSPNNNNSPGTGDRSHVITNRNHDGPSRHRSGGKKQNQKSKSRSALVIEDQQNDECHELNRNHEDRNHSNHDVMDEGSSSSLHRSKKVSRPTASLGSTKPPKVKKNPACSNTTTNATTATTTTTTKAKNDNSTHSYSSPKIDHPQDYQHPSLHHHHHHHNSSSSVKAN